MKRISQGLEEVVRVVFPDYTGDVSANLSPDQLDAWDSMGHLNLISTLQEKFKIEFDFGEIMEIETIGDIQRLLTDKGIENK